MGRRRGRAGREGHRGGRQGGGYFGAGRGTFSDLLAAWTAALGGKVVRYQPFDHEPMRAANRQVFGVGRPAVARFRRGPVYRLFRGRLPGNLARPHRKSARVRGLPRIPRRDDVPSRGAGAPDVAHRDERGRVVRHRAGGGSRHRALHGAGHPRRAEQRSAGRPGVAGHLAAYAPEQVAQQSGLTADQITLLAREFVSAAPSPGRGGRHRGSQHAGAAQVCAAVNILNDVAGNIGKTVRFGADLESGDGYAALAALQKQMEAGQIAVLVVHEANPVYALPSVLGFCGGAGQGAVQGVDGAGARRDRRALRPPPAAVAQPRALGRPAAPRRDRTRSCSRSWSRCSTPCPPARCCSGWPRRRAARSPDCRPPSWEAYLKTQWQAFALSRKAGDFPAFWVSALAAGRRVRRRAGARRGASRRWCAAGRRDVARPSPARASSSSRRPRPRCSTTAAAPTSPGCWKTPIRSPRSPGSPGSKSTPKPRRSSTSGREKSCGWSRRVGQHRGAGLSVSGHSPRRGVGAAGLRAHQLRAVRHRPRRQRAGPAGGARRRGLRAVSVHPGFPRQDPPLPEGGQDRGQQPAARPGHHRGDAAGRCAEGTDPGRGASRGGRRRRARDQHPAGTRGHRRVRRGPEGGDAQGQLRRRSPAVGHGGRPGPLHRLLRVRDGLLRREQHPDGRRGRGAARPRNELDADRAVLRGRRGRASRWRRASCR